MEIVPKVPIEKKKQGTLPLERLWSYLTIKQLLDQRDASDDTEPADKENSPEKKALALALKVMELIYSKIITEPLRILPSIVSLTLIENLCCFRSLLGSYVSPTTQELKLKRRVVFETDVIFLSLICILFASCVFTKYFCHQYEFVTPLTSLVVVKPNATNAVNAESVDKAGDDSLLGKKQNI